MTEENTQIAKNLQAIVMMIEAAELNLKKAKQHLSTITSLGDNIGDLSSIVQEIRKNNRKEENDASNGQIVYGEFDGYFMVGEDNKKYPIPLNYSSKSKLVPGDKLKLTISESGELTYKLIEPCERKHVRAVLSKDEQDSTKFIAITGEGQTYTLNQAAVTFFKGYVGDELYVITNSKHPSNYAAIEAIIKS
jgi:hypothetical protein